MSEDFKVEIVAIDAILEHPNADRLEIAQVKGWNCVTGKGVFKPGDKCLYIPIDSVLPAELEAYLFPEGSKITLRKSRVRTEKIRGAVSQGMVVALTDELNACAKDLQYHIRHYPTATDLTKQLGVVKYEPPEADLPVHLRTASQQGKACNNPKFQRYTDIPNFKNNPHRFTEGEPVTITEKLHGTSARYAKLPTNYKPFWKKILRFFGLLPKEEFCYGSRNMQLQDRFNKKNFYPKDVYGKIAKTYNFANILQKGESLYGELLGSSIQANYTYGCTENEHIFFAYDVQVNGTYLSPGEFHHFCSQRNIPMVPVLYEGPFSAELANQLRSGDSLIGGQKVREGIVIKPQTEQKDWQGRKIQKYISDEFLLKDQTDFH